MAVGIGVAPVQAVNRTRIKIYVFGGFAVILALVLLIVLTTINH